MTVSKDVLEKALQGVEAKKHAYRQTREGTVVSFLIHPDDVPKLLTQELSVSAIGARYMLGIVRMEDESDYPVVPEEVTIGERAFKRACLICRDPSYISWIRLNSERWLQLYSVDESEENDETYASDVIRNVCGVLSRKDLKENKDGQTKLTEHINEFMQAVGR
tara:strand:- start:1512 stop:2003 length:492 start_codon:yes stop_codon:yes gene_type:complete